MNLNSRQYREPDIEKYGKIGSEIPGSRFFRAYCPACGQPVRVTKEAAKQWDKMPTECAACLAALHPGHGSSGGPQDIDADGSWSRVIENYEELQHD
jgi:predicted RNA-binding Zn-ribbon protein involved in translation (DUF1610 family)